MSSLKYGRILIRYCRISIRYCKHLVWHSVMWCCTKSFWCLPLNWFSTSSKTEPIPFGYAAQFAINYWNILRWFKEANVLHTRIHVYTFLTDLLMLHLPLLTWHGLWLRARLCIDCDFSWLRISLSSSIFIISRWATLSWFSECRNKMRAHTYRANFGR